MKKVIFMILFPMLVIYDFIITAIEDSFIFFRWSYESKFYFLASCIFIILCFVFGYIYFNKKEKK